jgi:hypothetical protein
LAHDGGDWERPQAARAVIRSTGVLAQQSCARGSSLRPSLRAGHRVPSGPCVAPSRAPSSSRKSSPASISGPSESGRSAQLHETLALRALERFDHTPRRMVLFGGVRRRRSPMDNDLVFSANRRRYPATRPSLEEECRQSVILFVSAASAMVSTPIARMPCR